jgi:hypothetical protein
LDFKAHTMRAGMRPILPGVFFAGISRRRIVKNRTNGCVAFLSILALVPGVPLQAQTGDQGKAPVYTYISEWLFRGHSGPMVKLDEQD